MKTHLRPLLILLPVIIVVGYLLVQQSRKSEFSESDRAQAERTAQGYENFHLKELKDWKGQSFSIAKDEGAPVLIMHFWASWCAPCIHEFPELIKMVKSHEGRVKVVAMSEDSDEKEIAAFLKSFPEAESTPNFHIVWDQERSFMKQFDAGRLPESFIYGPDRKLARRITGAISWVTPESAEYLKFLAQGGSLEPR